MCPLCTLRTALLPQLSFSAVQPLREDVQGVLLSAEQVLVVLCSFLCVQVLSVLSSFPTHAKFLDSFLRTLTVILSAVVVSLLAKGEG